MDRQEELIAEIEAETRATGFYTGRYQLSPRVIEAIRKVRRELFVPEGQRDSAYCNMPLGIGHGQTISQPFIVAIMTDLLDLNSTDIVLEIGTGSGYQAAILAELVAEVCTIEVIPALADRAQRALTAAGYRNVAFRTGDGALGWAERAPFDAIMVTAAAPDVPAALIEQLRPGRRMIIPVGHQHGYQNLILIEKDVEGAVSRKTVLDVAFVPLTRPEPS
jgi:protein-L-isoaspartate(D-aspartate) O-methyltransferase